MKNQTLTSLATFGFLSTLAHMEAVQDSNHTENTEDAQDYDDSMDRDQCEQPSLSQEGKLLSQINAKTRRLYDSLNCEGKNLAIQLAEQKCKGQNECKGLNSCGGARNDCSGKGSCKGTSLGPFKDKNIAVQVAAKHMSEKRAKMYYNQRQNKFNNRYGY